MAENDTQTVLVPSGSAAASGSTHPTTGTSTGTSTGTVPIHPVLYPATPEYYVTSSDAGGPVPPQRRPSLGDRLRTPIAGAILGGVVILGVGFGAGYVVGKDNGSGASSTVGPGGQTGQFGQGGPGGGGQFGGGTGGFGGQAPNGQSQQGTTQQGTTQQGTTQGGATTTQ